MYLLPKLGYIPQLESQKATEHMTREGKSSSPCQTLSRHVPTTDNAH
jgi:hypothetical protein